MKTCKICHKAINEKHYYPPSVIKGKRKQFCSLKCRGTAHSIWLKKFLKKKYKNRPVITKDCLHCGKKIIKTGKHSKDLWDNRVKFCSRSCTGKNRTGVKNPSFRGGRYTTPLGYVSILKRDHPNANALGRIFEHRLVMEKSIERFLDPKEVVHHINGKKDDNRLENLQLFSDNGTHMKYRHRKKHHNLLRLVSDQTLPEEL